MEKKEALDILNDLDVEIKDLWRSLWRTKYRKSNKRTWESD